VRGKVRKVEILRKVVNVFDAENWDILPEISDALQEERNVPSVTKKVTFLLYAKPKVKIKKNQK
jgi:hypothetical protein